MKKPSGATPSPNIWNWPEVYEIENLAQDRAGAVPAVLREVADWTGNDVVDIGCGTGFHLPFFARDARTVIGVEPHPPLVVSARRRAATVARVRIVQGSAEHSTLPDDSVDVVHARTAYFFGPGCGPGIQEAMRILRPGGALVVVDLDATAAPYGPWMRADLPHYDPQSVETFFAAQGFDLRRVDTRWTFDSRADLEAVLAIEFSEAVAGRAIESVRGTGFDVRYRVHTRRKPAGLLIRR